MSRYQEPYHSKEHFAHGFDKYPRKAFIDHFFEENCRLKEFASMKYKELGSFINSEYSLVDLDRDRKELELNTSGSVLVDKSRKSVRIFKKYDFKKNSVMVNYRIKNQSVDKLSLNYGSEINLSLDNSKNNISMSSVRKGKIIENDNGILDTDQISELSIHELKKKVTVSISASEKFELWKFPVETLTLEHDKIEPIYQSTCFLLRWPIKIEPGKEWNVSVTIRLEKK